MRITVALAGGSLVLAGAALLARGSRSDSPPRPLPGLPRSVSPSDFRAEDGDSVEDRSRVAEFVARLKAVDPAGLASSLNEILQQVSLVDVLSECVRQAPLEQGFSVLRQLVAENPFLREAVLQIITDAGGDRETRLFALRLLPPFAVLGAHEKGALLHQMDRCAEGELGCQLVRYVSKDPTVVGVSPWLCRLLQCRGDPEVQAEACRALVRFDDPIAVSTLKRHFEAPDVPVSQKATILAALSADGLYERHPWLPGALERSIQLRRGEALGSDQGTLASHAVTILARNRDYRRLSCLRESETSISDPGGRALIAFALRWLPEEDAATTLASMASNPGETPKVRLIALESLRGKKSDAVVRRLSAIASEGEVPPDIQAAFESWSSSP